MFKDQLGVPNCAGVAPAPLPEMPPLQIAEPLPAGVEILTPVAANAGAYPGEINPFK
jgi:hypothetical protein